MANTRTGQLAASVVTTLDVAVDADAQAPYHRLCTVTNTSGGGTINISWGNPTAVDPPVDTAFDGAWRNNMFSIAAAAGSNQTFRLSQAASQIKLVSGNTPRYAVTVYHQLM